MKSLITPLITDRFHPNLPLLDVFHLKDDGVRQTTHEPVAVFIPLSFSKKDYSSLLFFNLNIKQYRLLENKILPMVGCLTVHLESASLCLAWSSHGFFPSPTFERKQFSVIFICGTGATVKISLSKSASHTIAAQMASCLLLCHQLFVVSRR